MLSDYSRDCARIFSNNENVKHASTKLAATFLPRIKYGCHSQCLKLWLNLGLRLDKVHRVLAFKQEPFLEPFISACTTKRANAPTRFASNRIKLESNSNYGKMVEQVRNRLNASFATTEKRCLDLISSPRFVGAKILHEDLIVAFSRPASVTMSKPIAVGLAILELSKMIVYRDYYYKIKPALGGMCKTIMSDTDSLCLAVYSHEAQSAIELLKDYLDFSKYPHTHPLYNTDRKNALGYWKDELEGAHMRTFVGLRSKVYCLDITRASGTEKEEENEMRRRCKGLKRKFKDKLPMNVFTSCVHTMTRHRVRQVQIRSRDHIVTMSELFRLSLSSFDDKQHLYNCGIHSTPYGSKYAKSKLCPFCWRKNIAV